MNSYSIRRADPIPPPAGTVKLTWDGLRGPSARILFSFPQRYDILSVIPLANASRSLTVSRDNSLGGGPID